MRVKMLTLAVGPKTHLEIGKVYDLPPEQADALIAGRHAVLVDQAPKPPAKEPERSPQEVSGEKRRLGKS